MKRFISIILAAVMVLALVSCGSPGEDSGSQESGGKKVKAVIIGSNKGGSFWGNIEQGLMDAAAEKGWEADYWAPTDATNEAVIIDLCDTALTQGYDIIAPVMNNVDMFEDFLARAKEAGVIVIGYNSDPGEDKVPCIIGINSYESGKQQGEKIAEFAKEKGFSEINYINMCTSSTNESQKEVKQGVLDGIQEAGWTGPVNELGEGESQGNAATAQDNISSLFVAHPEINTIFCIELYSALGASAYIEEKGIQGQIIACGLELTADAFRRVLDGSLTATSSVDTVWMGAAVVEVGEKLLNGEAVEYNNYPDKIWVLPEDVDTYAKEHGIDMD